MWKVSEGNSTKAARVADWLLHVAPSQGTAPPSPLAEHPPSDSEPVTAFSAPNAFASPDPKRRSSIDFLPPRPGFFNSSPASSFPGSPDGTPTVTRRNGANVDRTENSLDMPRTPTDNYSSDSPYPIRHKPIYTPTPPPPRALHALPPRPHKPTRVHFTAPSRKLRRGGSLDSLVDPAQPSDRLSDVAAVSTSANETHSSPHSLGTSQSSGAFTLSSVADDTLFFSPPTRPRAHRPPALLRPGPHPVVSNVEVATQGVAQVGVRRTGSLVKTSSLSRKGSTRSTVDSLVDPGISPRNSGGTQLLQA